MTDTNENEIMENTENNEGIKGLRDKLKSVEAENKELKNVVKTSLFKDVGLDPTSLAQVKWHTIFMMVNQILQS